MLNNICESADNPDFSSI